MWSVKCEVRGVKNVVSSVKKRVAWGCIAPVSRAAHVLGQHRNSFAQSTHARAWLAHGACKFYRRERSHSTTLRQIVIAQRCPPSANCKGSISASASTRVQNTEQTWTSQIENIERHIFFDLTYRRISGAQGLFASVVVFSI